MRGPVNGERGTQESYFSELVEEEEGHHGSGGEAGAEGDVCDEGGDVREGGEGRESLTIHDVVGESSDQSAMGAPCQVDCGTAS